MRQQNYYSHKHNRNKLNKQSWLKSTRKEAVLRYEETLKNDLRDRDYGYKEIAPFEIKRGWLFNVEYVSLMDNESGNEISALKLYLIGEKGEKFCAKLVMRPYFYLKTNREGTDDIDISNSLASFFSGFGIDSQDVELTDLEMKNHLSGTKQEYKKISFPNQKYLSYTRDILLKQLKFNKTPGAYKKSKKMFSEVNDVLEHDISFVQRALTDSGLRIGRWHKIAAMDDEFVSNIILEDENTAAKRPSLKICAFDIETTKQPLRFPDAEKDFIMMISLMVNGRGYLVVNREIVSEDIEDFEYTPKPQFPGPFKIFNEKNESALLERFFTVLWNEKPDIYVTYNGDFFDWPFIEKRCEICGVSLTEKIGIWRERKEFKGSFALHLDAFNWVKRDSYLPMGAQGLKAVTKVKLGYNPVELDPEKMVPFARENPQELASYSVSDAVATFYLYTNFVHSFIFSLCSIIPLPPNEVLRKGAGTLCEAILIAEAFRRKISVPNKQETPAESYHNGRLLESETYVGGHVECIEAGVFREDIPVRFNVNVEAVLTLKGKTREIVEFAITQEHKLSVGDVENLKETVEDVESRLSILAEKRSFKEKPLIYHFDVISMYPNIILSNRLQPVSIVTPAECASCDFNLPENNCKRYLQWKWRGKTFSLKRGEYEQIKAQLDVEEVPSFLKKKKTKRFSELPLDTQKEKILTRVKDYSRKVYKKVTQTSEEFRESCVCQRENPFYVDSVKSFRDRRYLLKNEVKKWRKISGTAKSESQEAKNALEMSKICDSMQLAHKCILNSFYGYVMRKKSRWYSMPMAAITTNIGANIIKNAREILENFSRPLELDTDGVWCCLPESFPVAATLKTSSGEKRFSFLCSALNVSTHSIFANKQFQTLTDPLMQKYTVTKECSIFFEEDGPYRCMLLPASTEEGKTLKKRYAVFNKNGSLAELKGFELKRRGELKAMKVFQTEVFSRFLEGRNLEELYQSAAEVSNYWLDIIDRKGQDLEDNEVFDFFSESKNMSKSVSEYGVERSTSITCAKRLAELMGIAVSQGAGLSLNFVISRYPLNTSVSDRVIPTVVFHSEEKKMKMFLRRWCKEPSMNNFDVREIIDWNYYRNRIGDCIRKIVTLPAAIQNVKNPVSRLPHPKWLKTDIKNKLNPFNQSTINNFFQNKPGILEEKSEEINKSIELNRSNANERNDSNELIDLKKKEKILAPEEDFLKWLPFAKKKWRDLRRKRPLKRKGEVYGDAKRFKVSKSLSWGNGDIFEGELEVIKIEETNTPGKFTVWVRTCRQLFRKIEVEIPRSMLIHRFKSREESEIGLIKMLKKSAKVSKSKSILPRNIKNHHLYKLSCSEPVFNQIKMAFLRENAHPETEGTYELSLPLLFKAVTCLGLTVAIKMPKKEIKSKKDMVFKLKNLIPIKKKKSKIGKRGNKLADGGTIEKIFIYFSHFKDRGILAVFLGSGDGKVEILMALINSSPNEDFKNLNVERISYKHLKNYSEIKVDKKTVKNYGSALKQAEMILKRKNAGTSALIIQSSEGYINEKLSVLKESQMPVFKISFHSLDANLPLFRWPEFLVTTALRRFSVANNWWRHQLNFSRYCGIPPGNLSAEDLIMVTDVLFSRVITDHNFSLWAPGSAGKEVLGAMESFEDDKTSADSKDTEVVNQGMYRSYCVEVEISFLAVCAVLESDALERLGTDKSLSRTVSVSGERANVAPKNDGNVKKEKPFRYGGTMRFETKSCGKHLRVLRRFLNGLLQDVVNEKSEYAELLLANFHRWVRSDSSMLYGTALRKYVGFLVGKYFEQVCGELRKLGVAIVHATLNRIVVATDKAFQHSAIAYVKNIIETVKQREIFTVLEMSVGKIWKNLLFFDSDNFAGMEGENSIDLNTKPEKNTKIVSQWNICEFIPPEAEKCFQVVLATFITNPHEELQKVKTLPKKDRENALSSFSCFLIKNKITRYLFEILPKLKLTLENTLNAKTPFHKDAQSSVLSKNRNAVKDAFNPTLTVVNYICKVVSLDKGAEEESMDLQRNLLKLIGVAQFSPEAKFSDPCHSFVLEDIICGYCGDVRSIDLCKTRSAVSKKWTCGVCSHLYDTEMIESKLLNEFNEFILRYHNQDVICKKCQKSRVSCMEKLCSCSGEYEIKISVNEFEEKRKLFGLIAEYYEFEWLEQAVNQSFSLVSIINDDN